MPRRGQRIGDAYVAIHGDGTGMDRDVRRDLDDLDVVMRDLGEKLSEDFQEGFRRGNRRFPRLTAEQVESGFEGVRGVMDAQMGRITGIMRTRIREQLTRGFGVEVGGQMADEIEEGLVSGRISTRTINSLFPSKDKMQAEFEEQAEVMRKEFREAIEKDFLNKIEEDLRRKGGVPEALLPSAAQARLFSQKYIDRMEKEYEKRIGPALRRLEKQVGDAQAEEQQRGADFLIQLRAKAVRDSIADFERFGNDIEKVGKRITAIRSGTPEFADDINQVRDSMKGLSEELERFEVRLGDTNPRVRELRREMAVARVDMLQTIPTIDRQSASWRRLSDRLGRITGRGSRNNLLNFIGSVNRNLTNLLGATVFGLGRAGFSLRNFIRLVRDGGLSIDTMAEAFGRIASGMNQMALNMVGVVTSFSTMIGLLGIASATLSGLGAIVTSLAASLSFGIAGGLGAIGGSLLPLAAGIGVVALAIKGLDDDMKDTLRDAVQPMIDEFDRLAEIASGAVFGNIEEQIARLTPVTQGWEGTIEGVGTSISKVGDYFLDALESPGFKGFRREMEDFLPKATRQFGKVSVNVLGGLGGLFRAVVPLTERFLGWIKDITGEFAVWSNTTEGQETLIDFFDRAGDSAAALGDFLGASTRFLGRLFGQTASAGDTIFERMAGAIDDAADWLDSPEGRRAIDDWTQFALDFGEALGDAFLGVVDLFDALDNPSTRAGAINFFEFLGDLFREIADVADDVIRAFDWIFDALEPVVGPLARGFVNFLRDIPEPAKGAGLAVGILALGVTNLLRSMKVLSALTGTTAFLNFLRGVGPAATTAAGAPGKGGIAGFAGRLGGLSKILKVGGITTAVIALFDAFSRGAEGVERGSGIFDGLVERGQGAIDTLIQAADSAGDIISAIFTDGSVQDAYDEMFKDLPEAADRAWNGVSATSEAGLRQFREDIQGFVNETFDGLTKAGQAAALESFYGDLADGQREALEQAGVTQRELVLALQGSEVALQSIIDKSKEVDGLNYIGIIDQLDNLSQEFNLAADDARDLATATQDLGFLFDLLPDKVASRIELDGIVPTEAGLVELRERYDQIDGKTLRTIIDTLGIPTSLADIKALESRLDALPDEVLANVDLTNFTPTIQDLAALKLEYDEVDNRVIKTLIELTGSDITLEQVNGVVRHTKQAGDEIDANLSIQPDTGLAPWYSELVTILGQGEQVANTDSASILDALALRDAQPDLSGWEAELDASLNGAAGSALTQGASIGVALSNGFDNGVDFSATVAKVRAQVNTILAAMRLALNVGSPSRATQEIAEQAVAGFEIPFERFERDADRIANSLVGPVLNGARRQVSGGRNITIPEINVISNSDDPRAVAQEVFNHAVAVGY